MHIIDQNIKTHITNQNSNNNSAYQIINLIYLGLAHMKKTSKTPFLKAKYCQRVSSTQ